MQLAPRDGQPIAAPVPLTFGVVFRPGEVPQGKTLQARLGAADVTVQLDAKRCYADGSLKHGVVSMLLPRLDAAEAALAFAAVDPGTEKPAAAARAADKLLAGDFDATVTLTFPEGQAVTASARKMLSAAGANTNTWLNGPVAIEWLLSGAPQDEKGRADPDLVVQFQVRHYPATGHTRVSAVVERCTDAGSDGGIAYDVAITKGAARPETVFAQKNVRQPDLTRWRKVFWTGAAPADVTIRHDARVLVAAGVIPQYDLSLQVPRRVIDQQWKAWQDPKTPKGLFENGFIVTAMGATGGRPDLGPLTGWAALYLHTMDWRQKEIVQGLDEISGGIPVHARSAATGRVPAYEDRPLLWLDRRGGNWGTQKFRPKPAPPRVKEPIPSIFTLNVAHHPSLGYVSYLVTGDYFYLMEVYSWASYIIFSDNPGYSRGTLCTGELRARAWSLRTVSLAAGIAPDRDPEQAMFARRIDATLKEYAREMAAPDAMPLHMVGVTGKQTHITYAPWQHDYMIMAADCAVNAGFADAAAFRTLLLDFSLGRFTSAPDFDPHQGCGYWWTIVDAGKGIKVVTWKDLAATMADQKPGWADYAGGYCDLALASASIGLHTGHPRARAAYDFLVANAPNVPKGRPSYPCFAMASEPGK